MYENDKKRLKRKLKIFLAAGVISKKKRIYFFGINDRTRETILQLGKVGIKLDGIIENDTRKQGLYCRGVRAIPFSDIDDPADKNTIYLLHSGFWREMRMQLLKSGIREKNIIELFNRNPVRETFIMRLREALKGKKIYRNIQKKYGENKPIFLCPYTGTGDIYLIGTLLPHYLKEKGIDDYVVVVVSTACKKVAQLFHMKNIEQLKSVEDCSRLICYYMFCPEECRMEVLNDSWGEIYTNPVEWFRGYKGLDFTEMFRRFVFRLPESKRPVAPELDDVGEQVKELMEAHSLLPEKTVLLSPYSNTLADMPEIFWSSLAKKLKDAGYCVCTNSGGKDEPAVPGTEAVFAPLTIAPQFVEACGYFVGIRSGFCDVVSAAKAKKVILYDKNNYFYYSRAIEYFSLNRMGLCDDAIEIEFENADVSGTVDEVLSVIKGETWNT